MRQGTCWSGGGALVVEAAGDERKATLLPIHPGSRHGTRGRGARRPRVFAGQKQGTAPGWLAGLRVRGMKAGARGGRAEAVVALEVAGGSGSRRRGPRGP